MPGRDNRIELTPPELEIMLIIWEEGPLTAREVREALRRKGKSSEPSTVATYLDRLRQMKRYIDRDAGESRDYRYFAVIAKDDYRQQVLQDVKPLFDSERDFLHGFAGASGLSEADKRKLRRLADQLQRKGR